MELKIKIHPFLFKCVLTLVIFFRMSATSSLFYQYPSLMSVRNVIRVLIIGLFLLDVIYVSKFSKRWLLYAGLSLTVFIVSYFTTKDFNILFFSILMIMARDMEMDSIIQFEWKCMVVIFILFLGLCFIGVLPDYIYSRGNGRQAHTLGFTYYSYVPMYTLYICVMYLYIHKNTAISIIVCLILSIVTYLLSTKTLTLLFGVLFAAFYFATDVLKLDIGKKLSKHKFMKYLIYGLFPIVIFAFIIVASNYDNWKLSGLNDFSHNRIYYSFLGLEQYGITLFGNDIEMYGGTSMRYVTGSFENFFLDSGLLVLVLKYGILAAVIVYYAYYQVLRYSIKENNKRMLFWALMVLAFNIGANNIIDVWFNPILLFMYDAHNTLVFNKKKQIEVSK